MKAPISSFIGFALIIDSLNKSLSIQRLELLIILHTRREIRLLAYLLRIIHHLSGRTDAHLIKLLV